MVQLLLRNFNTITHFGIDYITLKNDKNKIYGYDKESNDVHCCHAGDGSNMPGKN